MKLLTLVGGWRTYNARAFLNIRKLNDAGLCRRFMNGFHFPHIAGGFGKVETDMPRLTAPRRLHRVNELPFDSPRIRLVGDNRAIARFRRSGGQLNSLSEQIDRTRRLAAQEHDLRSLVANRQA